MDTPLESLKERVKVLKVLVAQRGFSKVKRNAKEMLPQYEYAISILERALADSSHESSGLNKPVVTVSLPLSNEQILKGIQTSPRYQLPKEWLKNEHTNSNYMGGFLNAVKWMEGNAR